MQATERCSLFKPSALSRFKVCLISEAAGWPITGYMYYSTNYMQARKVLWLQRYVTLYIIILCPYTGAHVQLQDYHIWTMDGRNEKSMLLPRDSKVWFSTYQNNYHEHKPLIGMHGKTSI